MAELLVFGENLKGINHLLYIIGNHWVVYVECIGNYCVECLPTRTYATYKKWIAHIGKGLPLIWYRVTRQQSEQGCPDLPSPQKLHPALQRGFQCASRPLEWPGGLQLVVDLPQFLLPVGCAWNTSQGVLMPPPPGGIDTYAQAIWFEGAATLPWAPHPFFKTIPGHLAEETLFFHLYPASCSFSHIANFLAIGEGRNVDWPVNREL